MDNDRIMGTRFLLSKDREKLLKMLGQMGESVEHMILMALRCLQERDDSLAHQVIRNDDIVDEHEIEIEQECLRIIGVRHPVREELRFFFSILKIITDLERMADESCNIAKHALILNREPLLKPLIDIPKMASACVEMLRDTLSSFENNDPELAKKVFLQDQEVDTLYDQITDELFMIIGKEGTSSENRARRAALLQMVARNLERIGDHAANISERSFFMSTGKQIKKELPPCRKET